MSASTVDFPSYEISFANIWCEIDDVKVPFKLLHAGISQIIICGESETLIEFEGNYKAKMIFRKQFFDMGLVFVESSVNGKYHNYKMKTNFEKQNDFKKWLIFIKTIFSLYLKKSNINLV